MVKHYDHFISVFFLIRQLHLLIQDHRTDQAVAEIQRLKNNFNDVTVKKYLNKRNDRGMVSH